MQKNLLYPKRPVRAACLAFVGCAVWVSIFLPFLTAKLPPKYWPVLYSYCALLAVVTIGLVRLGRSAFLPLCAAMIVSIIPGFIGVMLGLSPRLAHAEMVCLRISLFFYFAVGALALFFAVRGWLLYFKPTDSTLSR